MPYPSQQPAGEPRHLPSVAVPEPPVLFPNVRMSFPGRNQPRETHVLS